MSEETAGQTEQSTGLRGRRLVATLIDLLILGPTTLLIMLASGIVESAEAWVMPQPIIRLTLLVVGSYILLNGYTLVTVGQTLGKRVMGLRIQSAHDRALLPWWKLVLRAYTIIAVTAVLTLNFLPLIYLVNVLFLFGKPQRCLHDYLAGSTVVRMT
jgi:uncharacterized RDD family membrane protein YckC